MTLTSHERRDRILAEVLERRHVTAKDLASRIDVSEATVRRDLKLLADAGKIDLVYGGATLRRAFDSSFQARLNANHAAKQTIGRLAAELVADGGQILVDSGTTCFEMASLLKRRRGLSVIVNSARLALELDAPGLNVIVLGGQYRPDRMDMVGPLATATLEQLRGYVCFIGSDGLSMDFGVSAGDVESANLYRLAARHARETVLLADQSKFSVPSLFKIIEWDAVSRVVTDARPADDWTRFFEERGIECIYPGHHQAGVIGGDTT